MTIYHFHPVHHRCFRLYMKCIVCWVVNSPLVAAFTRSDIAYTKNRQAHNLIFDYWLVVVIELERNAIFECFVFRF